MFDLSESSGLLKNLEPDSDWKPMVYSFCMLASMCDQGIAIYHNGSSNLAKPFNK
jgi:hypothetical protein